MRDTYRITKRAIVEWWQELSRRGHFIIIGFALGLILAFVVLAYSAYYALETKTMYRNKIERNSERIDNLEQQTK